MATSTHTEAEIKQALKVAVGTAVYGVKAIYDYQDYEIMTLLREIMNEASLMYPKDFFK